MVKKAVFCACNFWYSPSHVGSHHLAKALVSEGWEVAFISDPISLWHGLGGLTPQLRDRFSVWRTNGKLLYDRKLWTWVPFALFTPQNKPFLRSSFVQNNWASMTIPPLVHIVKEVGFDQPDLVYVDSPTQSWWWKSLQPKCSFMRLADNPKGFGKHTATAQVALQDLVQSVDLVAYTAEELKTSVDDMGAKASFYLPNGVDYQHFSTHAPRPNDYNSLPEGKIVLYIGALEEWFDFDLLAATAKELSGHQFVLIGSEHMALKRLPSLPNVHILGARPFKDLPAYIQHADVGLIPFNVQAFPELVHTINPLKLYEYMAGGLPVVASAWRLLEKLNSPALLYNNQTEFIQAIQKAPELDPEIARNFASACTWQARVNSLLKALNLS